MTDANALAYSGLGAETGQILAAAIDAGDCEAHTLCGPALADFQALAVAAQVNSCRGDAEALKEQGISPQAAEAIAKAINARRSSIIERVNQ